MAWDGVVVDGVTVDYATDHNEQINQIKARLPGEVGSTPSTFVLINAAGTGATGTDYIITATSADIKMNGVQAVGSLHKIAPADHIHPVDTSREATLTKGNLTASSPIALDQTREVIGGAAVISHVNTAGNKHVPTGGAEKQVLISTGTSGVAEWSTATYLKELVVNEILFASAANVLNSIDTANSGVLVTSAGGVPSIATDIPTAVTIGTKYIYRADGTDVPVTDGGTGLSTYPKRSIFLSLAGGWTGTTNPDAGFTTTETNAGATATSFNIKGTLFDAKASGDDMTHEFSAPMPDNWNGGTVTAIPYVVPKTTPGAGTTLVFGLRGACIYGTSTTGDLITGLTFGTAATTGFVLSTDSNGRLLKGAPTPAITISGATPVGGSWVQWKTHRAGSDTYASGATLLGWLITYTTDNYSDE
jgi:hypothetical protein